MLIPEEIAATPRKNWISPYSSADNCVASIIQNEPKITIEIISDMENFEKFVNSFIFLIQ